MNTLILIASIIGAIIFFQVLITLINILQKGGAYKGKSIDEILGVSAQSAKPEDVLRLSKPEVMQLYYAAKAPDFKSIKGEYRAKNLPVGVQAFSADFYTHHFFGPGRWEGKAFLPENNDSGYGYNIFRKKDKIFRTRKMNTSIGKSNIDDKPTFHVDYKPHNGGTVHSMHDEIRSINDTLYIGMGYMGLGGGSINPAPFIVYGKATPWVGLDTDVD